MNNKDLQVLQKIAAHIQAVLNYSEDCHDIEDFQRESMRVEACVFNLMQIGELAKQSLSDSAKEELENIPWKQLYGMRNRIVHGYEGVDMNIVWDTVSMDLPGLLDELKEIIKN